LFKDYYLLRIKSVIQGKQPIVVYVNGSQLSSDKFIRIKRKGIIETNYIYLPENIIKPGINFLDIGFSYNQKDIDVIFTNYRKSINENIYILFSESAHHLFITPILLNFVTIFIFTFILFALLGYYFNKIFHLSLNNIYFLELYSILPFAIFLFMLIVYNLNGIYKLVFNSEYLIILGMVSFFVTGSVILLNRLVIMFIISSINSEHKTIDAVSNLRQFISDSLQKIKTTSKKTQVLGILKLWVFIAFKFVNVFFRAVFKLTELINFSVKCIFLFIIFLIFCPILLFLNLNSFAELVANLAYFILIVGIVIKFLNYQIKNHL